jgi:hypothetical protein
MLKKKTQCTLKKLQTLDNVLTWICCNKLTTITELQRSTSTVSLTHVYINAAKPTFCVFQMSLPCLQCDITLDLKSFNIYFYTWKYLITEWFTLVSQLYLTTQFYFLREELSFVLELLPTTILMLPKFYIFMIQRLPAPLVWQFSAASIHTRKRSSSNKIFEAGRH